MLRATRSSSSSFLARRWPAASAVAALTATFVLGTACSGVIGDPGGDPDGASSGDETATASSATSGAQGSSGAQAGSSGATTQGAGGSGVGGSGAGGSGAGDPGSSSVAASSGAGGGEPQEPAICKRWNDDRADLGEGTWSGSVAGCNAGDVSADGRANALKLVNLYRFMANLPAVATDPTRDQKAQACALMMDANDELSHSPPMNWMCYSADGAQAAGNSNISGAPGVGSVDTYMSDFGNESTMGHRRWILSGSLGPIGLGSTDKASCMWVIGGSGNQNPPFTAWPPPGEVPIQAINLSFLTVDQTGWTIQSSVIDLSGAQVKVTDGGQDRPVTVSQLLPNYGSTWAIKMIPSGWTSEPGHTYTVAVSGVSQAITYDVEIVDCN